MTAPKRKILASGKYLKLVEEGHWEYADRTRGIRAVVIVALTQENELVLTEQYRVPVGRRVIDFPAGLVGDEPGQEDELDEPAARRELLEETGYEARRLKKLISGPTTSGMASEVVTFYLARDVKRVQAGGGVDSEDIQVHVIPLEKAVAWLNQSARAGKLIDVKTFFAIKWLAAELAGSED